MTLILGAISAVIGAVLAALFHQLILAAFLGGAAMVFGLILIVIVMRFGQAGYRRMTPTGRMRRH